MNKRKSHWRLKLLRWHRRLGVVLGVFLLWMIISGVLLNHDHDLALDKKILTSSFWLNWYGVAAQHSVDIGRKTLHLTSDGLWLDQQNLGVCSALLGAVKQAEQVIVACPEHILLLTLEGDLIDQTDSSRGLSQHVDALAVSADPVFLKDRQSVYRLNTDDLSLTAEAMPPGVTWQNPVLPDADISLERWLQDAHSGRLFGRFGPWLVDILAGLALVLVLSGWILAKKRHRFGVEPKT